MWYVIALICIGSIAAVSAAEYDIPIQTGIYNHDTVLYVITDISDDAWFGEGHSWNVQVTPSLYGVSPIHNTLYVFVNGPDGEGLRGHQSDIFEHVPGMNYTALSMVVELTWVTDPDVLHSAAEVSDAIQNGRIIQNNTGIILNAPQLLWPGGQLSYNNTYGEGPLLHLDRQTMISTFMAYPATDTDGNRIHYIMTGSSSIHLAEMLGVAYSPLLSAANHTDMVWYIQDDTTQLPQGEISTIPGNHTYSPVWRIHNATWTDMDIHIVDTTHLINGPVVVLPPPSQLAGIDLSRASPPLGDIDAPITIIEFGDYQCPKCGQWFDNTKHIIHDNYIETGKANMYFLDLVFLGRDSHMAAAATYCAQEQNMYWEFHDTLYKNQGGIQSGWASRAGVIDMAQTLNLDITLFQACLDDNHQDRIDHNTEQAYLAGFNRTPSFMVVGPGGEEQISGNQPYDTFERVIDMLYQQ